MSSNGPIDLRREGEVAVVLLAKPPLNILDMAMMKALSVQLDALSRDDGVSVVVLESALKDVFSAGAEVKEHLPATAGQMIRTFEDLILKILTFPRATVALVRGKCLGGGMELALACDFVLAGDRAIFGQPEVNVGVYPPAAAAIYPRLAGLKNAYRVLLTGKSFPAVEAASMGLVTSVHREEELDSARKDLLDVLTSKSRIVLQHAKRATLLGLGLTLKEALRASSDVYLEGLMGTADATEGLTAFLEKRTPKWKHK